MTQELLTDQCCQGREAPTRDSHPSHAEAPGRSFPRALARQDASVKLRAVGSIRGGPQAEQQDPKARRPKEEAAREEGGPKAEPRLLVRTLWGSWLELTGGWLCQQSRPQDSGAEGGQWKTPRCPATRGLGASLAPPRPSPRVDSGAAQSTPCACGGLKQLRN